MELSMCKTAAPSGMIASTFGAVSLLVAISSKISRNPDLLLVYIAPSITSASGKA